MNSKKAIAKPTKTQAETARQQRSITIPRGDSDFIFPLEGANDCLYQAGLALEGLSHVLTNYGPIFDDISEEEEIDGRLTVASGVGYALRFIADGIGRTKDDLQEMLAKGGAR